MAKRLEDDVEVIETKEAEPVVELPLSKEPEKGKPTITVVNEEVPLTQFRLVNGFRMT